jgi:hypothetical protein
MFSSLLFFSTLLAMGTTMYIFGGLILAALVVVIVLQVRPRAINQDEKEKGESLESEKKILVEERARLMAERDQRLSELAKIHSEFDREKKERSELEGKGKRMFVENTNYKNDIDNLRKDNLQLQEKISKYEAEKKQNEEKQEELIKKLSHAHEKFESEQKRVVQEDEADRKKRLEERDRMWNDHENSVLSVLRETCQKPEIAFRFFDNNNLPEGFHGQFKPDFLVEFMGQYLYLDAKVSRSENLETYLKTQFKSTAEKLNKFEGKIYKNVFFIVPTNAIASIKKRMETIEGFNFFVISPEAIEPVLFAYKRITEYEGIEDFDPEEREKIVEVLANFEHFIKNQNTVNILFAQKAFDVLQKKEILSEDFLKQFELELKNLKPVKLKESDFKKTSESVEEQKKIVHKLTAPEVKISQQSLAEVLID